MWDYDNWSLMHSVWSTAQSLDCMSAECLSATQTASQLCRLTTTTTTTTQFRSISVSQCPSITLDTLVVHLQLRQTDRDRHTHTTVQRPLVRDYPGRPVPEENSPTYTHPDHRTSFINFLHWLRSIASSVFNLRAWQYSRTTSLQVLFGLPLGLGPSSSYSIHFFSQSLSSFRSTCPYQRSLICWNTNAMSSIHCLSLSSSLGNLSFSLTSAYGARPVLVSRASRSAVAPFSQLDADRKVTT